VGVSKKDALLIYQQNMSGGFLSSPTLSQDCVTCLSLYRKEVHELFTTAK